MQMIRKNLKPILLVILIAFVVSIFYGLGQYRSSGNGPQNTGGLIAEVNNTGITYQQWQNAFSSFISRYDNQTLSNMTEETLAFIKNNITEQLVNSTLLYQYAEDQNISIPANEVDGEIAKIKVNFDSETEFNEALRRSNLTLNQLKDNLNRQFMIEKAIEQEYAKIEISEEEISQYYEKNEALFFEPEKRKIRHILVETTEEAQIILNQLNDGIVDFDRLARDKSLCPSSERGGDLGYITQGQMVRDFELTAFSLEVGEISGIVETEYGYHIIICDDIQKEHQPSFEEAKEDIINILKAQKQNTAIETLVAQLREDANVKIHYDFTSELATTEQMESQNLSVENETSGSSQENSEVEDSTTEN